MSKGKLDFYKNTRKLGEIKKCWFKPALTNEQAKAVEIVKEMGYFVKVIAHDCGGIFFRFHSVKNEADIILNKVISKEDLSTLLAENQLRNFLNAQLVGNAMIRAGGGLICPA